MTAWLTPQQVAEAIGEHFETVREQLRDGRLHGHKVGRHWKVHPGVPDVFVRGGDTREPCGCARVTRLHKARAS